MRGLLTQQHDDSEGATAQTAASSSSFDWTMKLFGGGGRKATQAAPKPARVGRPGSTQANRHHSERESLINARTSTYSDMGDAFDDSDAISLLSNIADRDSRTGSSAAAAPRRARALHRSEGRTCGMLMFDLQSLGQTLSCGLLGRPRREPTRRTRADSFGSVIRGGSSSGRHSSNAPNRSRAVSDASADDSTSIFGTGRADSGDEDAGMLDDTVIARFGHTPNPSTSDPPMPQESAESAEAEAKRKAVLQEEAQRAAAEAEAEALAQKQEEERLAAEEEAAVLKARRKAERKAAKQGLIQNSTPTKSWRTEAEAEAAAGGFGFAEDGDEDESAFSQQPYYDEPLDDYEHPYDEEREYSQYDDAEENDGFVYSEQGPGGVVHHHHYYHPAPAPVEPYDFSATPTVSDANVEVPAEAVPSEDEADIAGLSFGRKKSRSGSARHASGSRGSPSVSANGLSARGNGETSSRGSGSGSGLRSYQHSPLATGAVGPASSSSAKPAYRDSPRRHERTASISTNSSSGKHSYQSGVNPASTIATSIAPAAHPSNLPSLYEKAGAHAADSANGDAGSLYTDPHERGAGSRFGKSAVDANEFGIITAGTDKGGAGRAKKSYRDKRQPASAAPQDDGAFEGFPGF